MIQSHLSSRLEKPGNKFGEVESATTPDPSQPPTVGADVVVTAYRSAPGKFGGFSFAAFRYGQDYGSGASKPDPFEVVVVANSPSAHEIVSRGAESIALAIKTLVNLTRPVLPSQEEQRLDALVSSLEYAAKGLKAGDLDLGSARSAIETALSIALDTLTGSGMGVLFGALGAWATTLTPSPALKALGTAGFGVVGLAADWYISDTGAAKAVAKLLTDGLFNGAQALSDAISNFVTEITNGTNPLTELKDPFEHQVYFELETDGIIGNFDGESRNGSEAHVQVYHSGLGSDYLFTTNKKVYVPDGWVGNKPHPVDDKAQLPDDLNAVSYSGIEISQRQYETDAFHLSTY